MATVKSETKVITNKVRISYAHIWKPKGINGGDPKYSVSILISKDDEDTINCINQAVEAAKEAGKGKFGGKIPASLKMPLRDGDIDRPDDENYVGHYFVNASSATRPGIIDVAKKDIEDEDEVYSGCYVRASINFYAFNTNGNKGIACGLNNLQKVADGEKLSGRASAADDFDDDATGYMDDDFEAMMG